MLTIFVGPRETIQEVTGRILSVYPLLVREGAEFSYLQDRLDCSDVEDIEILVPLIRPPHLSWELKLTAKVKKGINAFLHNWHAKQDISFDCYSFACLVCGVGLTHKQNRWTNFWKRAHRPWRRVGDVVFLLNKERPRFHAAIYIGFGFYISVCGAGGDLEVATLKDMKKDFDAPNVVHVVHRT